MKSTRLTPASGKLLITSLICGVFVFLAPVSAQEPIGSAGNLDLTTDSLVVADDATGFVVSSDATSAATADRLHRVNLRTGVATMIGPLGPVGGMFEDVEGLALDESGRLFGVDDDTKTLLSINAASGLATSVNGLAGNTRIAAGQNPQDLSLAFSCAGQLYAAALNAKTLYRVDTGSGVFSVVGAGGQLVGGITDMTVVNGQMYGLGTDKLYRIDIVTGISTAVGNFGGGINFFEGGGLAADSSGQLWASAERRDARLDLLPSQIYQINSSTGSATLSASTAIEGIESLVIGPPSCARGTIILGSVPSLSFVGGLILLAGVLLLGRRFS
jgi:hypothetical protein